MGVPEDVGAGLDLFKSLVFDPMVEAVLSEFEGELLLIPVVGAVVNQVEMDFANALYDKLSGVIVLNTSLFVSAEHRQAFNDASINLNSIANQFGLNSKQYKDAHEREKQALKKFGQFSVVQPGLIS